MPEALVPIHLGEGASWNNPIEAYLDLWMKKAFPVVSSQKKTVTCSPEETGNCNWKWDWGWEHTDASSVQTPLVRGVPQVHIAGRGEQHHHHDAQPVRERLCRGEGPFSLP